MSGFARQKPVKCERRNVARVVASSARRDVARMWPHLRSEQMADAMTAVTAFGCEISVRCDPPWNMVICECARWAIASSDAGVMI